MLFYTLSGYVFFILETLEERTVSEFIEDEAKKLPKKEIEERENRKENLFFNEDLKSNRFIFNLKAEREKTNQNDKNSTKKKTSFSKNRVQDDRLKEMFDEGTCLTMHQPWASLLIKGIKVHEGRVWNSSHRGRLWIHSGMLSNQKNIHQSENGRVFIGRPWYIPCI